MNPVFWKAIHTALLTLFLVPVCRSDLRDRTIPNRWPLFLLLCGLLIPALQIRSAGTSPILYSAVGALAGSGLGLLCRGVSREGFGWGDVKLLCGLGAMLGLFPFLRGLALTGLFSMAAALFLLLVRHASPKDSLPFAPFLAAGAVLSEGLEWFMTGGMT